MVKASALYMVIIIALVIGLLCSALIVAAYFYRAEYQRKFRFDQLENNVSSGINILLASNDTSYLTERAFSLFNKDNDSVSLQRFPWGLYDIGVSRAFIQNDTLIRIFSLANTIDSSKWAALYLMDEDRPFSLSGKTTIRGDAYIPKAGIKEAYIDNIAYQGDKRLIIGNKHFSEKTIPALDEKRLRYIEQIANQVQGGDSTLIPNDTLQRSFLQSSHIINFHKTIYTISHTNIKGNIILFSDTTITIDSTAVLNNILVFGKVIEIKTGFQGNAQFFATDSIHIDSNCRFGYPSVAGILRFESARATSQEKIWLGKNSAFNGIIFTYEKTQNPVKPLIVIGKNVRVKGQIYAQGTLELGNQSEIDGSVFAGRFLYQNGGTLYENYLINTTIDSKALTPYYLTSGLLPVAKDQKKILQWLEVK